MGGLYATVATYDQRTTLMISWNNNDKIIHWDLGSDTRAFEKMF
jgi:hypothetical protein